MVISKTMIIAALSGQHGDASRLLRLQPGQGGFVDLSADRWEQTEILNGLQFKRIRLVGKHVGVNFVDCLFDACRFERLQSEGHFWAAGNTWQGCHFVGVELRDVVSPGNLFEDCSFDSVSLVGYRPSRTVFRRCRFRDLRIEGMRAVAPTAEGSRALKEMSGYLAFLDCEFERSRFLKCFFAQVEFRGNRFVDTSVTACSFQGVVWDKPWAGEDSEPFLTFLQEVLAYAEARFGRASGSYRALDRYLNDYRSGRTKSRDYSAVLYEGGIPDRELEELEDALDELESRYPF